VAVAGCVEDPNRGRVLGEFREERCIRLDPREIRTIHFDFRPRFAVLPLRITRGGDPLEGALVSLGMLGDSIRPTGSDGTVSLELPFGPTELWVGHADRVVVASVEVTHQGPRELAVDLETEPDRRLDRCPEGVEPLLRGDRSAAAEALERAGQPREAQLLRGELCMALGDNEAAVAHFLRAGRLRRAATLLEALGRYGEAAEAYFGIEDVRRAAELFRRVERWEEAGEAYRRAFLYAEAASCYEKAGLVSLALPMLERAGLHLRAGEAAVQLADHARAVRAFRRVPPEHPDSAAAGRRLQELGRTATQDDSEPGDVPSGAARRFEILESLGRGSMGVVFKAYDRVLHRTIALKRLPRWLASSPRAAALFLSEARVSARLNHPHIVTIYDVVREGEMLFLAMEFLDGPTLRSLVEQRGALGTSGVLRVARQALAGLGYAHTQEVIHRDIKAENLVWTQLGLLKIADFGLARVAQEVSPGAKLVRPGSAHYMAPEQFDGHADARSDLYSLGVCLFELATGRLPFIEGELQKSHCTKPRPRPRDFAPGLPSRLEDVILRMMEIEAEARFQSAEEALGALERIAADSSPARSEPPAAGPTAAA
jgi:tetratricopeptide (TPR) repeat protein